MPFSTSQLEVLKGTASRIRVAVLKMLATAGSGHSGGALGLTDVFTALYFHILNHRPSEPLWPDRDRLLVSNGHTAPVWYATLAEAGYFPKSELQTLRRIESRLQGHPLLHHPPGIENTSGPLGQGLSQAVGITLSHQRSRRESWTHCIMSDAEQQEGQVWEAYQFAAHYRLDRLVAWIDRNHIQIGGTTESELSIEPLATKLKSFGWHVQTINGHDFSSIIAAWEKATSTIGVPHVIICLTIPGKGVPEMEGKYEWHGKPPSKELAQEAIRRLQPV